MSIDFIKEEIIVNRKLSYCIFRTEEAPQAVVFTVHGMQEHKERYEGFARYLNKNGIACVTYDLPGHGKDCSSDELGWFGEKDGWFNLVDSAVEIAKLCHEEFPGVPVICFGHSMGTMVARTFLQDHEDLIDGMILSGAPNYLPASKIGVKVAAVVTKVKGKHGHSHLLDNMATGSFNKSVDHPRTSLDWLSFNTQNVDTYIADPLCGFPFTCQGYKDLFEGMGYMSDISRFHCKNGDLPIWMFAGEEDPCCGGKEGLEDSAQTLRKAGYHNVVTSMYPGMRHETLHEDKAESVMKDVADWVLAHTK